MDFLTVVLQLLFGWLIKKWPALAAWPSKLIPLFNLILAILIRLGAGLVAPAHAADSLGVTGTPSAVHGQPWWIAAVAVLLNTLVSTGIFSAVKNVGEHFNSTPAEKKAAIKAKEG